MLTKIKFGFGAVSVAFALVGCGAGQVGGGDITPAQDVEGAKADSLQKSEHPEFYSCQADSDCVAVEKAGCCPNGFLVAVNQDQVKAYDTSFACTDPPATCPLFVVHDTRVAQCDFTMHQCQMIDPTAIRCEGFIDPSLQHHCPAGYECSFVGHVPDVPGNCVAATTGN